MNITLSLEERRFLDEVLGELMQYKISSKDRAQVKEQILEHIQESREHGEDTLEKLDDPASFVRDYLEINKIDLHTEMKQLRANSETRSSTSSGIPLLIGSVTFFVSFLALQLLFTMFLTDSFNNERTPPELNYHILYQISDSPWWNGMLILISLFFSLLLALATTLFVRRKRKTDRRSVS